MRTKVLGLVVVAVTAGAAVGCGGGDGQSASGPTSSAPSVATATTRPLVYRATVTQEREINGIWRQGVARVSDGWIFITNDGIARTGEDLQATATMAPAIPASLKAEAYNHLGDGDVDGSTLWVPVEKDDKDQGQQVLARYDANTLAFVDSFVVDQHHASFVTVGPDGTIYSTDEFSDDALTRYKLDGDRLQALPPLKMSRTIENIQGGDVADGAIWLSTDDDHDGLYRVDPDTGAVQDLGTIGHADGEGEGIDATQLPSGLLHAMSADVKLLPMRLVDEQVSSASA